MIRFVARTIGLWLAAGGFAAAVIDGMKSIAASRLVMTSLADAWSDLAPASLSAARALVEARLGGWVWSTLVAPALTVPLWAVAAVLGAALISLARPPRAPIGHEP
ncbi:hypothetical protein EYW49_00350 [Siculibacillus lacustris]|uniref:PetM family of cytochrome b6f complex subunit 7 n=1 Tax=Siculibacillus lacustris TaxID=1549641 RepID=A0A4Q9VZH2_9HYPH|nr:hypothetical protein [Siculibacillus lacustris]TBW41218.1 hypothetical protein EYW49_00350 [Siculibacillus lacustris]